MKKFLFLQCFTLLLCSSALAQIANTWSGELSFGANKLALSFTISQTDGNYSSTMSVPAQGVKDFQMDTTRVDGESLRIVSNRLGIKYDAKYDSNSNSIDGVFRQSGLELKLTLTAQRLEAPLRPQEPKAPFPYSEEQVTFTNPKHGNKLSGTLTSPTDGAKCPAVVLVSGSGPQNRDSEIFNHKIFLVLADYLTRNGIAVLRYDDRGVGQSEVVTAPSTTADLAYDAQAAMDYLRRSNKFSSVGVIGHSEGGLIAFMLAGSKQYTSPDFIVTLGAPGVKGSQILLSQSRKIQTLSGIPPAIVEQNIEQSKSLYELIENSERITPQLREAIIKTTEEQGETSQAQGTPEDVANMLLAPWFYHFIKYNPQPEISNTKIPTLSINGSLDVQVLAEENLSAIESALKTAGNKDFTCKELEGLNHLLQSAKTGHISEYAQIEQTISPTAMKCIGDWINQRF